MKIQTYAIFFIQSNINIYIIQNAFVNNDSIMQIKLFEIKLLNYFQFNYNAYFNHKHKGLHVNNETKHLNNLK